MARRGSDKVSFFLLNGNNLIGTLTEFQDTHEAVLERTDVLGDTFEEHSFTGVRRAEITQSGFFDDAPITGHNAITTGPGVSRVLSYGIGGTATGAEVINYSGAMEVSYTLQAERGALHKAQASYRGNGTFETGKLVQMYGAPGATGKSNVLDLGGAATGLAAYLQWNATQGETKVSVRHSASGGATAGAALLTFTKTDATNGYGAERLATTGTVQQFVWFDVTTASSTGSIADFNYMGNIVRPVP